MDKKAASEPNTSSKPKDYVQPVGHGGMPGEGAGRRDEASGSGVYPASSGQWPDDAVARTEGEWGRGGDDAGTSEIIPDLALTAPPNEPGSSTETGPARSEKRTEA